jgi:6-pyruvoyltetrahydropterin/6-carboxytetrahydropterin synthase
MTNQFIIKRHYHFYAGHRNAEIGGKCGNPHGHQYEVTISVILEKKKSVTLTFEDIDKLICPIIEEFDHSFIMYGKDPLYKIFGDFGFKMYVLGEESSAENVAQEIYERVKKFLPVFSVELKETKSSTVVYMG